jgi:hypothetical protein
VRPLGFVVVTFDEAQGPVISNTVPASVQLSGDEVDAVRFHAFPDSSLVGDLQFSFRFKSPLRDSERCLNDVPASAATPAPTAMMAVDTAHLFGHVFFRSSRDASLRRGSWSVSIVLLVRYPFVALYKRVMERIGTAYFASAGAGGGGECSAPHGSAELLESAFHDMNSWPLPRFAQEYELPLLGHALMFRAPPVRGVAHILDREHVALAAFSCASPISNLDSVNVYEVFCDLGERLWLVWELVLCGEPLIVYGTDAGHSSDAVYAALSLIAPLEFGGEVQPFYTVQDSTFAAFSKATKGGPLPAAVIGTSNPFFFQAFGHWPHVLSVGELDGDSVSQRRSTTQLSQVRAPSTNRARTREGQRAKQTIVSTRSATISAPRAVLDKLLDPRNIAHREPLARVDSWERVSQKAAEAGAAPPSPAKPTAVAAAIASASSALSSVSSYLSAASGGIFTRQATTPTATPAPLAPATPSPAGAPATPSSQSSWMPSINIKLGSVSISINNDDDDDDDNNDNEKKAVDAGAAPAPDVAATTPIEPQSSLSPILVSLPADANVLPVIQDGSVDVDDAAVVTVQAAASPASAPATPVAEDAPVTKRTPLAVFATALTSSIASASESVTRMAAVPTHLIRDAIWPTEQPRTSAEELVLHNNSVLRSHFLQLTQSFLAPFESYVLQMVRRGKVAAFSEKEFLEFVRVQRPLRVYTGRDLAVLSLYQRFCRSVNFHVWLTSRLDLANAGLLAAAQEK